MAKGVSDQFLRILENERRLATRHLAWAAGLALVLLFVANLADEPLFGTESFLYAVALFLGIGGGIALGWRHSKKLGDSLKGGWNQWMRMSTSCTRVDEVWRKASGKPAGSNPAATGLLAAGLLVLNALLFALLWVESSAAKPLGLLTVLVDGGFVGGWIGNAAWRFGWVRSFTRALEDLLRDGTVGIWGER